MQSGANPEPTLSYCSFYLKFWYSEEGALEILMDKQSNQV